MTRQPSGLLRLAPNVERALIRSQPVVALESALVAHGLPHPDGLEVARTAEERIRAAGAVPATIAVIDGAVKVGIDGEELERLVNGAPVRKVGPRDLAACAISGGCGATTVAGTLAICRIAGIHFLATGGIGGVHRGWSATGDISADLHELSTTPACVVCSGAKSLLDVAATLELLESLGVPTIGYRTDCFPLFYVRESPHALVDRTDDPGTLAAVAAAHWGFSRRTGVLVVQPVAAEAALGMDETERLVEEALAETETAGVAGPAVTPFVLARLHERSTGRTLAANRRLVADNATLAAEIAVAYFAE